MSVHSANVDKGHSAILRIARSQLTHSIKCVWVWIKEARCASPTQLCQLRRRVRLFRSSQQTRTIVWFAVSQSRAAFTPSGFVYSASLEVNWFKRATTCSLETLDDVDCENRVLEEIVKGMARRRGRRPWDEASHDSPPWETTPSDDALAKIDDQSL